MSEDLGFTEKRGGTRVAAKIVEYGMAAVVASLAVGTFVSPETATEIQQTAATLAQNDALNSIPPMVYAAVVSVPVWRALKAGASAIAGDKEVNSQHVRRQGYDTAKLANKDLVNK